MKKLRQAGLLAVASVLLTACSFAAAAAHTTPSPKVTAAPATKVAPAPVRPKGPQIGTALGPVYAAQLKCPGGLAEDSAAHVRLVRFDHNDDGTYTIVYHCKHLGY